MSSIRKSIVVLGGGSWGTAIAHILATAGHAVTIIMRNKTLAHHINTLHENTIYLPGIPLHPKIRAISGDGDLFSREPAEALASATIVVLSIPCQELRTILKKMDCHLVKNCLIVNTAKGIELGTLKTVEQILKDEMPHRVPNYAILSGPSFAEEVIKEKPTAVAIGCRNKELGISLQEIFSTSWFRAYSSTDVTGIELGGAIKNIIAIAAGISDGLGFAVNTRVALITRGLAEISRLGKVFGASVLTFSGLSGLGDLVLTCSGDLSRNKQVGIRLGKGESLHEIITSMNMVAEGIQTTYAVHNLAIKLNIDMPITRATYNLLEGNLSPQKVVELLMDRQLCPEMTEEQSLV